MISGMTERVLGAFADMVDLDDPATRSLRDVVLAHLGPNAGNYDVPAAVTALRKTINQRLPDELEVDEDDQVVADGWTEDEPRGLLDDALYAADLDAILERYRTTTA